MRVQSVWDFVSKGGVMMIPLAICSLIGLTVVVERAVSLRRGRIVPPDFLPGLRRQLERGPHDTAAAVRYCTDHASPIASVLAAGFRRAGAPLEVVERHVQEAGERAVLHLRKHLRVLAVIASVAPLMGLLGTIFGMITAFQTVATSADALGKTELLAEGIYEAMITTAAGLVVAIPALIAYHWLLGRVQRLVMEIDETTLGILDDRHDARTPPPAAPPATPAPAAPVTSVVATGNHHPAPAPTPAPAAVGTS